MRCAIALVFCLAGSAALAAPETPRKLEIASREAALKWIGAYRSKPQPARVPDLVRGLSDIGAFNDPESAGAFVGFVAGVLGTNPGRVHELLDGMVRIAQEDHWVLVRAVAYSGLPEWKDILLQYRESMPTRRTMIEKYVTGALPTLVEVAPAKERTLGDKVKGWFSTEAKPASMTWAMTASPELLDTLWGYYFATGSYSPIYRMLGMLPWSKDRDDPEKLTVGSMTKYTLAINAARDASLRSILQRAARHQPADVAPILSDLLDAAETADTVRIRKEQVAAIEEIKRRGPGSRRELTGWGRLGEGAIGVGCVTAAVMSVTALGIPCVVGGAATSAALRYWGSQ